MFYASEDAAARPRANRQAICAARVLCIAGLVLIHIAPYGDPKPFTSAGQGAQFVYAYVIQVLARASVPLLSVISGFLLASSLGSAERWRTVVRRRVRSLLVPLILWNALSLVWSFAASGQAFPADVFGWLQALIGITAFPALDPLHFLRDLFLCVAASPLLVLGLRRMGWALPALLLALCVFGLQRPVILSDSILPFFVGGLGLGLGLLEIKTPPTPVVITAGLLAPALTAVLVVGEVYGAAPLWDYAAAVMLFVQRIAGALLFWWVARALAASPLGAAVARVEPVAFLVFCSHPFVIAALWALYKAAGLELVSPAYIAFAAVLPPICFAVALVVARLGARLAPLPLSLLTGGKLA